MKQNQTINSLNITSETKSGKKPTKMTVCLQNISRTCVISLLNMFVQLPLKVSFNLKVILIATSITPLCYTKESLKPRTRFYLIFFFFLLFADSIPQMVGFRTPLSSSVAKMNLTDTNKTIILPNYYFGKYGLLMALKSNTTRAGYIKFQVRFTYM